MASLHTEDWLNYINTSAAEKTTAVLIIMKQLQHASVYNDYPIQTCIKFSLYSYISPGLRKSRQYSQQSQA